MQYNNLPRLCDELGNKLVKHVLWGISIIGFAAFVCSMTDVAETILIIEIATTSSALLVSAICLAHLYQEHQVLKEQEQQLIQAILNLIQQNFKQLPPLAMIEETLLKALNTQEAKEQRLNTLGQYRLQPSAVEALVRYCKQQQASRAVLADLGLRWD